jgi:hypothetical protein
MRKFNPYHQHLLVRCWATNPPKKVEELNNWFINLVEKVGMKVVAGPTSVYISDPGNEGLTGTVTLATSHASKSFGLVKAEWVMIDRNNKPLITSEGTWE